MAESTDVIKKASILVVDDTPENLYVLSDMLKNKKYEVRPVPSGALALLAAKNKPPDIILLDIRMPEMDGYEVCKIIKADEKLKEIPIIFISALSETLDKVKAFAVGGADYITKPFQFEEVNARIKTHLELMNSKRELRSLLSDTLTGSIKVMVDILTVISPQSFYQSARHRHFVKETLCMLGISETWTIELAAMLSNLGCVAVPPYILKKKYSPALLNEGELKILRSYPVLGAQLVSQIPKLEMVSEIIKNQLEPLKASSDIELLSDKVILGSQMLKFFNDYDGFLISSANSMEALKKIEKAEYKYPVILINALKKVLKKEFLTYIKKNVKFSELEEGMILEEDIHLPNGAKLMESQTELSPHFLGILKHFADNYNLKQNVRVSVAQKSFN
jgi:response regulator RpfG family c-di-GMP phosphodiesterase